MDVNFEKDTSSHSCVIKFRIINVWLKASVLKKHQRIDKHIVLSVEDRSAKAKSKQWYGYEER